MAGKTKLGKLQLRPGDVELTPDQLSRTPLLAGASKAVERRLRSLRGEGAMVVRRYRAGDVIVKQGEPGWTAFYMMRATDSWRLGLPPLDESSAGQGQHDAEGPSSIGISSLMLRAKLGAKAEVTIVAGGARATRTRPGLLRRAADLVFRGQRRLITTLDAAGPLEQDAAGDHVGYIREGELFGEGSCFTHAPRSATVRAMEDCYVIEMVRNVLETALDNERFRTVLDKVYRRRVLESELALIPLLQDAPAKALATLRADAELLSFEPGQQVFEEGGPVEAFYFVRMGTVKLLQGGLHGRVLRYASRGEVLGLEALLDGGPHDATCVAYAPRSDDAAPTSRASVRGVRVELVRVPREALELVMRAHGEVAKAARRMAEALETSAAQARKPLAVENVAGALGLIQAEKVMLIDLDRCTRCDDCVRACADTHDGVARLTREGPRFGRFLIPSSCRQCLDPTCLLGCPVGSIHRGPDDEIVVEDWCIGCGLCVEQCPYDAIAVQRDGDKRKAYTCDQCASVGDGTPMCVYACGADAAQRVDGRSFFGQWGEKG